MNTIIRILTIIALHFSTCFFTTNVYASNEPVALPIKGIAHVAFQSSSLERSRAFYTGFVGYEFAFAVSEKRQAWYLKVNDQQFVKLIFTPGQTKDNMLVEIGLQVDDAARTYQLLKNSGFQPSELIQRQDGTLATTLRDPDNHLISFVEYTSDSLQIRTDGKHLGARRIAQRLQKASFAVSNASQTKAFYKRLGLVELWRGPWSHDDTMTSVHLKLPGERGDLLTYILTEKQLGKDDLSIMQHATYLTGDVRAMHGETGKYGRPRLDKYALQTDEQGRPFFNLYCTDGGRVKIEQTTVSTSDTEK